MLLHGSVVLVHAVVNHFTIGLESLALDPILGGLEEIHLVNDTLV